MTSALHHSDFLNLRGLEAFLRAQDGSKLLPFSAALALLYLTTKIVYNIYFHPLSKYPGPKLQVISQIPTAITRIRGKSPQTALKLHNKYGPIVRIAPAELSYNDSRALKDIYGHRVAGKEALVKDMRFYGADLSGVEGIIRARDESNHARQRRVFSHAFSDKALREQEDIIKKYADKFAAVLKQRAALQKEPQKAEDARIDLVRMFNYTTFDVMGELAYSEPLDLLENGEYTPWVAAIFGNLKFIALSNAIRRFPLLEKVFTLLLPASVKKKRQDHFNWSVERCDRRMASTTDKPDIWNLVIRNKEEKNIMRGEMYSNSSTMMLAGTETTATLLSGLTYHLCRNPEKMQRLVKEIRTLPSPDELTITNLTGLKYLQACLEEGLRLYPPVPDGLPRIVGPAGAKICDDMVPGGTLVYFTHLAAYHSAQNFADPLKFEPERWTPQADERYAKDDKFAFQPFSYGPRNCLGKNLAYHEMRLILASLLWNFDVALADENDIWTDQKVFGLWEKKPLYVRLTSVVH